MSSYDDFSVSTQPSIGAGFVPNDPLRPATVYQSAQFNQAYVRPVGGSSGKVSIYIGAVMIPIGSLFLLLDLLVLLGFTMDKTKSSSDVVGGVVAMAIIFVFAATLIGIGIFLVRHGSKERAAALMQERTFDQRGVAPQPINPVTLPQSQVPALARGPQLGFSVPANPLLFVATKRYLERGYLVVALSESSAILERPKAKFNSTLFLILLFLFGVGSLIYLLIFGLFGRHKIYRVQLTLRADQIEEVGDTIAVFERDILKSRYNRALGFGIFSAFIGVQLGLAFLAGMVSMITHPDPARSTFESIAGLVVGACVMSGVPLAIGGSLFWLARNTRRTMKAAEGVGSGGFASNAFVAAPVA